MRVPGLFWLTANTHTWKKGLCRPMDNRFQYLRGIGNRKIRTDAGQACYTEGCRGGSHQHFSPVQHPVPFQADSGRSLFRGDPDLRRADGLQRHDQYSPPTGPAWGTFRRSGLASVLQAEQQPHPTSPRLMPRMMRRKRSLRMISRTI